MDGCKLIENYPFCQSDLNGGANLCILWTSYGTRREGLRAKKFENIVARATERLKISG